MMTKTMVSGCAVYRWDSPAEFAADAAARGTSNPHNHGGHWAGETFAQAVKHAATGRTDLVAEAERLLEDIMVHVDAPRAVWVPACAGAYPMVPDALMGHPDSMRRRCPTRDERAPLRIYVDLTSSAGIRHEDLRRRGVACLALAMALSNERAVELYGVTGLSGHGRAALVCYRIGAAPLDLAVACNALTSMGLVRDAGYGWCLKVEQTGGSFAPGFFPENEAARKRFVAWMRERLEASQDDIIIAPPFLYDESYRDPVAFVKKMIAEAVHNQEEE